jgi:hypothetical protein
VISIFDLGMRLFQSETPPVLGVTREVREAVNINEVTCTCGK